MNNAAARPGREKITVFDRETGAIVGTRRVAFGSEPILLPPGQDWVRGRHVIGTARVDPVTGEVLPLLRFDLKLAANRIEGIPIGTKAIVNGNTCTAALRRGPDDESCWLHVNVDFPEALRVQLSHPLYEYAELDLDCTPEGNGGKASFACPQDCARLRLGAYPPLADLADALVKEDGAALDQYKAACLEVKAKYPKPGDKK